MPRLGLFTHCVGGGVGFKAGVDGAQNLVPLVFNPPTSQPVANRYADCSNPNCISLGRLSPLWLWSKLW